MINRRLRLSEMKAIELTFSFVLDSFRIEPQHVSAMVPFNPPTSIPRASQLVSGFKHADKAGEPELVIVETSYCRVTRVLRLIA